MIVADKINKAIKIFFEATSDDNTAILPIKPEKGGNPPKERIFKIKIFFDIFFFMKKIWDKFFIFILWKEKITVDKIKE